MRFAALALLTVLVWGCAPPPESSKSAAAGYRVVPANFHLVDASRYDLGVTRVATDGKRRVLVVYEKYERSPRSRVGPFVRFSNDGGASFGTERAFPPSATDVALGILRCGATRGGWALVFARQSRHQNVFFLHTETEGATWSVPVRINDQEGSFGHGGLDFVQPSERDVYCVWADSRRGFDVLMFSSSHDGGRTWSPNRPIEFDSRAGAQAHPRIVSGDRGRLLVFWDDGRDPRTLFDIRMAFSDDDGERWSPSRKVNDDREHAWQVFGSAAARGRHVYAVFTDFRGATEGGAQSDIYVAESTDNGATWSKNERLNDLAEGVDDLPYMALDDRGTAFCLWRSCGRSVFGHLCLARRDGPGAWRSFNLSGGEPLAFLIPSDLLALAGGEWLAAWQERLPIATATRFGRVEAAETAFHPEPFRPLGPGVRPAIDGRAKLFADDFSSTSKGGWEEAAGTWMNVDGAYMGVQPGAAIPYRSFARFREPQSYVLSGRFKLDPLHHQMAFLYLRADTARRRFYVIGNGFRSGSYLSLRDDDSPPVAFGGFVLEGRPLVQRPFPFRNDRWYEFVVVATPGSIDYYVNNTILLSFRGELELQPGAIGVGGFASAPTYFDDIAVHAGERAANGGKAR